MTKYIDSDKLCKDILIYSPEDTFSLLRTIENQPVADVVMDICTFLAGLKNQYLEYGNIQSAGAIRHAIEQINKRYTGERV